MGQGQSKGASEHKGVCFSASCPWQGCLPARAHIIEALQPHPAPREGAGQGVRAAPAPQPHSHQHRPQGPQTHTHTHKHTQWTDGPADTCGLSSSISLAYPTPVPPPCPAGRAYRGPPPVTPAPPGWGSWLCPALLAPGLGSHPPRARWCTCYCWTFH